MQYKLSGKCVCSFMEGIFFHLEQIHLFSKSHCLQYISLKSVDGFWLKNKKANNPRIRQLKISAVYSCGSEVAWGKRLL